MIGVRTNESMRSIAGRLNRHPSVISREIKTNSTEEGRLIQKREVLKVLSRTSEDRDFWLDLMENGSSALGEYRISTEGKAAISSGDLGWINRNIGELTQKQLRFIMKRMEREAW